MKNLPQKPVKQCGLRISAVSSRRDRNASKNKKGKKNDTHKNTALGEQIPERFQKKQLYEQSVSWGGGLCQRISLTRGRKSKR